MIICNNFNVKKNKKNKKNDKIFFIKNWKSSRNTCLESYKLLQANYKKKIGRKKSDLDKDKPL